MPMLNISIPIPDNKITYKNAKNGKTRYVYHVLRRYRNKKGTPTADEKLIGKVDPQRPGRMIPNKNFENYYPMPTDVISLAPTMMVYEAGHVALLKMRADKIGLTKALQKTFPTLYEDILLAAIYMACEGNVMMNIDYFCSNALIPEELRTSSQRTSELFSKLSVEKQMEFFSKWKEFTLKDGETVAYDVTSVSSYADLPQAEFGYNRDREALPQLNIGLLYGAKSHLPISFFVYSGSLVDKVYFPKMLEHCESLGIKDVFFILDRGFLTKDNLVYLKEKELNFLMAVPKSQHIYKEAMLSVAPYLRSSEYHISGSNCYGTTVDVEIDEQIYHLYIYLNTQSQVDEEVTLFRHIDLLDDELALLEKPVSLNRYSKYYKVEREGQAAVKNYERDHEKITEAMMLLGMFSFISNQNDLEAQEALELYSQRDLVEKAFDSLKNELDNDRFLTHTNDTTLGKSFVCFIAAILWSDIVKTLKVNPKIAKTNQRLLKDMKTIRRLDVGAAPMLLQPLTKKQKEILQAFDIAQDEFEDEILKVEM